MKRELRSEGTHYLYNHFIIYGSALRRQKYWLIVRGITIHLDDGEEETVIRRNRRIEYNTMNVLCLFVDTVQCNVEYIAVV